MTQVKVTSICFETGIIGKKLVPCQATTIRDSGDSLTIGSPFNLSLNWSKISAFRLDLFPFKDSCLSLEIPFIYEKKHYEQIQILFSNSDIQTLETILQQHQFQKKPRISSSLLEWPLRFIYNPQLRKLIGLMKTVFPIFLLVCSFVELTLRVNSEFSLEATSASLQSKGREIVYSIYQTLPKWVSILFVLFLIPLSPLLIMYWVFIFILIFFHEWIVAVIFVAITINNVRPVIMQLRNLVKTCFVIIPYYFRSLFQLFHKQKQKQT